MAVGIIAEYNPFHNGHKYMLEQVQRLAPGSDIVVAMSGSITQRGEVALLDKWQRAKAAVENGASLVLELPAVFACRSAQAFAQGGVKLLAATGIVNRLAFGTEYPRLELLEQLAAFDTEGHPRELQEYMKQGLSYGSALSKLMADQLGVSMDMLREPNTILAIEYLRAIKQLEASGRSIPPLAIGRQGVRHNDNRIVAASSAAQPFPDGERLAAPPGAALSQGHIFPASPVLYASGTVIRSLALRQEKSALARLRSLVPQATWQGIAALYGENYSDTVSDNAAVPHSHTAASLPDMERLYPLLRWQLSNASLAQLSGINGISEGLEYRLLQSTSCRSYRDIVQQLATRRYPATRIQRLLIHFLTGFTRTAAAAVDASGPLYIRVLAFNTTGRRLLKQIKQNSELPIITKTADYLSRRQLENQSGLSPLQAMLQLDLRTTNLRSMCLGDAATLYQDLITSPVYVAE